MVAKTKDKAAVFLYYLYVKNAQIHKVITFFTILKMLVLLFSLSNMNTWEVLYKNVLVSLKMEFRGRTLPNHRGGFSFILKHDKKE